MKREEYRGYLKSEHWKEVREKRLDIDNHSCYLCGKRSGLNVHHIRYDGLWHEDINKDLVSLCYRCHSMLHRIMDSSRKEYNCFKFEHKRNPGSNEEKHLFNILKNCVKMSLIEELWLRDSSFGGDLNIFYDNMKTVKRLIKIVKLIYPDIKELEISDYIKERFKEASIVLSKKDIEEEQTNKRSENKNKRNRKFKKIKRTKKGKSNNKKRGKLN